jgi:hypothetical protein
MKKIFYVFSSLCVLIIFIIFNNFDRNEIKDFIKEKFHPKIYLTSLTLFGDTEHMYNLMHNDYNVRFLPFTQHQNFDVKKIKIGLGTFNKDEKTKNYNYVKNKNFLKYHMGKLIVANTQGEIGEYNLETSVVDKIIKLNDVLEIFDIGSFNNDLYFSIIEENNDCPKFKILKTNSIKKESFEEIFSSKECAYPNSAKITFKYLDNKPTLFLAYHSAVLYNDKPDLDSQNENYLSGKVIAINLDNGHSEIFTKGHRNIMGLYADDSVILSTEMGPRGGDEINLLNKNNNYGWDIASYGTKYITKEFYKNHQEQGFKEPLFTFIPSIGISELIKINGKKFNKSWQNNFVLASLNFNHIIRIKFSDNFSRVIFKENIYIGERIRDLEINEEKSLIFLSTDSGELIILTPIDTQLK